MFEILDELISTQEKNLLKTAQRIIPNITPDDLLQPNDFQELELHPFFRFEEGILDGLRQAKMALLTSFQTGSDFESPLCHDRHASEER